MTTELTTIPHKSDVPALFSTEGGIEALVSRIEKEARSFALDYSTDKGRKEAKSLAAKVSRSKTLIDEVGKEQNEERNRLNKEVNALRGVVRERLDALRDEIKGPAEAAEAAEAERVRLHMIALDQFATDAMSSQDSSAELQARIDHIESIEVGPEWEEFEADARAAKSAAIQKLFADKALAKAREEQEAELEALRAEKAAREEADRIRQAKAEQERAEAERLARIERDKKEAAERAAQEAEERARAEAEAAERRHQKELQESAKREAEAAQRERDRIAAEERAKAEAEAKRAADRKHRQKVRSEIVAAITELKPANWEELVDQMIWGKIPHVKVNM